MGRLGYQILQLDGNHCLQEEKKYPILETV